MSVSRTALAGVLLLGCGLAVLADDELPDEEFLDYLGFWEESDEEWLMFEEPAAADAEERSDPVPQGEESTETEDET
jgi:hypothetical protein